MNDPDDLGIVDTSWLTDADWAVINRLRRLHETEGQKAVREALRALEPQSYLRVAAAFFPDKVRKALEIYRAGLESDGGKASSFAHETIAPP
jgi:hypothetical protein